MNFSVEPPRLAHHCVVLRPLYNWCSQHLGSMYSVVLKKNQIFQIYGHYIDHGSHISATNIIYG